MSGTYTIVQYNWVYPPAPQGLKVAEAFARLMALNGYSYCFEQRTADRRWQLVLLRYDPHANALPFLGETFLSSSSDLDAGREEIMAALIARDDWPCHEVWPDEVYAAFRATFRKAPAAA
ncbi:MAG: hypothetical protein ISS15_05260 [Alphaproteobacteria bacterium]|nr:hypothetical protein [Alphaproteobacteria bacterium]MBL6939472.1 hypothetical protein [Alphaproteobacteria bacterium]MBL7097047.1 hypothetical protein [Alphaproteobacteria bacterium]